MEYNEWEANQVAYLSGAKDAISCVKEAIMEHYNDNLAGEDEISRFCEELRKLLEAEYVRGYNVGWEEGHEDGYSLGDDNGYERGYDAGYDAGYETGSEDFD